MARYETRTAHFGGWRRIVAHLVVVALVLQGLSLFAQCSRAKAPVETALATLSSLPGAKIAGLILCIDADVGESSGNSPGKPSDHNDPAACPMCQSLGCALAGAQPLDLTSLYLERLFGILSISALGIPAHQRAPYSAHPRGPPPLV